MLAALTSPALSIAIVVGALWLAVSGLWPTAVKPRPNLALVQRAAVGTTVFMLAGSILGLRAA